MPVRKVPFRDKAMRVEDSDVTAILEIEEPFPNLVPFITAANQLVTELCVPAGYPEARLKEIERWLAAHLFCVREKQATSESAGGVSTSYAGQTGMRLEATFYGQTVMMLDTEQSLLKLQNPPRAKPRMTWLGKERTSA